MSRYTCMIIEDEPLAQQVLKKYISDYPALELVAVCGDALEAQPLLGKQPVQLLFLDINLPKLSGIQFLKTLPHPPLVIFTTAYPEFAVEGFELDAVDYLLKPFSFDRFLKAVNRAIEKINLAGGAGNDQPESIFLRSDKKIHHVLLENIRYIEATGDYMKVVTDKGTLLVNETMKNMQESLPASQFIRVHKSYIVALRKISYLEGNFIQAGDKSIPVGATYRNEILQRLKEGPK